MMNFFARNSSYFALFSIGAAIVLLVTVLLARRRAVFREIRNSPLTPAEAFRKYKPPVGPAEPTRPRLTYRGRWGAILVAVFGLAWAGATFAVLHKLAMAVRLAEAGQSVTATVLSTPRLPRNSSVRYEFQVDGHTYAGFGDKTNMRPPRYLGKSFEVDVSYLPSDPTTNMPAGESPLPGLAALLPCACLALVAFIPARQLRRDLALARTGRLTTGIVVGVGSGQRSYEMWVYYDFADDQGGVTRGNASLRGDYWQAAAGSPIEVSYLPGNAALNNLKPAMYWQ